MSLWSELLGTEVRFTGQQWKTRVLVMGEGPPVVLLHGQGGSAENFARNIRALSQSHRVFALDLLWHGASEKPAFDHRLIPAFVRQVEDVRLAEGLGAIDVVGQSLGAWVAAAYALSHPVSVRRLVLATSMGIGDSAGRYERKDAQQAMLELQLRALADPTEAALRERMLPLVSHPDLMDPEMMEVRRAFYRNSATNASLGLVARAYFGSSRTTDPYRISLRELASLRVPTLVYWGRNNISPPAVGMEIAEAIPGARYHCADVGHWAQYEKADEFNDVVGRFLEAQPDENGAAE
jgi:pimeloyl-ACP methyl ester carboxylesterase